MPDNKFEEQSREPVGVEREQSTESGSAESEGDWIDFLQRESERESALAGDEAKTGVQYVEEAGGTAEEIAQVQEAGEELARGVQEEGRLLQEEAIDKEEPAALSNLDNKEAVAAENQEMGPRTEKEFLEEQLSKYKGEFAHLEREIESMETELGYKDLKAAYFKLEVAAQERHEDIVEKKRSAGRKIYQQTGGYDNPMSLFGYRGLFDKHIDSNTGKLRSLEDALARDIKVNKNLSIGSPANQEPEKYAEERRRDFELFEPTFQEVVVPNAELIELTKQAEKKLLPLWQERAYIKQQIGSHEWRLRKISEEQKNQGKEKTAA